MKRTALKFTPLQVEELEALTSIYCTEFGDIMDAAGRQDFDADEMLPRIFGHLWTTL